MKLRFFFYLKTSFSVTLVFSLQGWPATDISPPLEKVHEEKMN